MQTSQLSWYHTISALISQSHGGGLISHGLLSLTTKDLVTQQETLIHSTELSQFVVGVESLCLLNRNTRLSKPHNGAGLKGENIATLCTWRLDSQTALALAR